MKKKIFLLVAILCSIFLITGCEIKLNEKEQKAVDDIIREITAIYNNGSDKVTYKDGKILLTSPNLGYEEKEILSDVDTYFRTQVGQSDTCEGNTRIVFVMNDGTLSAMNIDALVCGKELKITSNLSNLKNIKEVYNKVQKISYEPDRYTVFAKDKNDKEYDITDALLK